MAARHETAVVKQLEPAEYVPMSLDEAAVDAARRNLGQGAVMPHYGPWRKDVIRLLNDSLEAQPCGLRRITRPEGHDQGQPGR